MKYACSTTDTSVTIRQKGETGSLTFGVGGPVAALTVAGLIDEINALHNTLESALTHDAFAAELARLRAIETAARDVVASFELDEKTDRAISRLAAALDRKP